MSLLVHMLLDDCILISSNKDGNHDDTRRLFSSYVAFFIAAGICNTG